MMRGWKRAGAGEGPKGDKGQAEVHEGARDRGSGRVFVRKNSYAQMCWIVSAEAIEDR